MKYVIRDVEADPSAPVGGKARGLAALRPRGLAIPRWFALTSAAFDDSLTDEQRDALRSARDAGAIQKSVELASPSAEVRQELEQALAELCPNGEPVAVRSSAADEDGDRDSFAGQLESFLGVPPGEVARKVAAVWQSGFRERVVAYRRERALSPLPPGPSVLIQRMVQPDAAGVAFGADPKTGRRDVAIVAAVRGLGERLVSGECDGDTWEVEAGGKIRRLGSDQDRLRPALGKAQPSDSQSRDGDLAEISRALHPLKKGTGTEQECVSAEMEGAQLGASPRFQGAAPLGVLDDSQVRSVAELVWRVGKYCGVPQDIEWAIEGMRLHLLQVRPITTLARLKKGPGTEQDGQIQESEGDQLGANPLFQRIWDNSNIGESYNGVTTPLTFSFARRAYEEVYRQFCRLLCVPEKVLEQNDDIFPNMLGLIQGRIYYNLLNWYRALALLPGFAFNRRFMEQMMGVKEGLPESVAARLAQATWRDRLRDGFHLLFSGGALIANHFTLPARTRRFRRRLDTALGTGPANLSKLSIDELAAHYRDLERQLLPHWDAPLVNDFLAMIFFGVLRKSLEKWSPDAEGGLHNDLIGGEKEMLSIEPANRIRDMARTALRDPALVRALGEETMTGVSAAIDRSPIFRDQFREYLDKFGDRCLDELKLESLTLHDDPLPLARSVALMTRRLEQQGHDPSREPILAFDPLKKGTGTEQRCVSADGESPQLGASPLFQPVPDRRRLAEERIGQALRWRPIRQLFFRWLLRNTRARVRDRENLRFERTRLFGRARQICLELGRRLHSLGKLGDARDVFSLEVQEILGFIEGTATCTDLRRLAALRKAEFDRYRGMPAPPGRIETRGPIQQETVFHSAPPPMEATGESRQGLGCCPGIVRGRVRVVADPRSATLQAGEILVAERTDPGWILLFPAAAGLLVERGSLLSHSAIVARELGIPAVISLPGLTAWLRDGDCVELDGSHGTVTRIITNEETLPERTPGSRSSE